MYECVCVYMSVYVSVHKCVCLCVSVHVCMYVSMSEYACVSVSECVCAGVSRRIELRREYLAGQHHLRDMGLRLSKIRK